jgi:hypothetical protein
VKTIKYLALAVLTAALLALPGLAQAKSRDRDHDRLPDRWEKRHHLSTHKKSAKGDPDRDSLSNLGEFRSRTDPRDADSDNDGKADDDEDRDRDHVDNGNEARERTNPRRKDSDRDGIRDGREDRDRDHLNNAGEDRTGNDPVDRDTDDDGVMDGDEQAGTVASFDGTTLVIDLAGGGSVSGRVTDRTEIECEDEDEAEDHSGSGPGARASHDGESGDEDHNEQEDEDEHCGTDALVPGARVHEAELDVTAAGAVWDEVELIR